MSRVLLYHLTIPERLPVIEEQGLRTRADLSSLVGPIDDFDAAAPGVYANGKRVSGWVSLDHARTQVDALGAGLVTYTVDPARGLAARGTDREAGDADAYWGSARPLDDWQADGELPDDLEVHVNVGVRAKYLDLRAPLFRDEHLGGYAPLVEAVADDDRLLAKAMMHLAILASDGDFDSDAFRAACAFAWRDQPDDPGLMRELQETGVEKVCSAGLASLGSVAPDVIGDLREALETTRLWGDENGMAPGQAVFARTAVVLQDIPSVA